MNLSDLVDPTENWSWHSASQLELEEKSKKYRRQCPVCPQVTLDNAVQWHENCGAATEEEHHRKLANEEQERKLMEEGIPEKGIEPLKYIFKSSRMPQGYMSIFEAPDQRNIGTKPASVITGMCDFVLLTDALCIKAKLLLNYL